MTNGDGLYLSFTATEKIHRQTHVVCRKKRKKKMSKEQNQYE